MIEYTVIAKDENREDVGDAVVVPSAMLAAVVAELLQRDDATYLEIYEGNMD